MTDVGLSWALTAVPNIGFWLAVVVLCWEVGTSSGCLLLYSFWCMPIPHVACCTLCASLYK